MGSWLAESLKHSNRVITYDTQNQYSNYAPTKAAKMLGFRKKLLEGVKQYKGDVRNFTQLSRLLNTIKPGVIVCLSSIPIENYRDENLQFETEVTGIYNILRASKDLKTRIVFMSSLFAIGHFDHAITENTHLAPITNYGVGKATGEHLVKAFANNYGIIRTTSVYGLGDINNRVPQIILESMFEGKRFWINKSVLLDFIYVKDLVAGIKKVISSNKNEVFNISGGKALGLVDFVKTVESIESKKMNYEVKSINDRSRRGTLVNDKARLILKWWPEYDLNSGIKDTLSLYRQHILNLN